MIRSLLVSSVLALSLTAITATVATADGYPRGEGPGVGRAVSVDFARHRRVHVRRYVRVRPYRVFAAREEILFADLPRKPGIPLYNRPPQRFPEP